MSDTAVDGPPHHSHLDRQGSIGLRGPDLLHHFEPVGLTPAFGNPPVFQSEDIDPSHPHLPVCGWNAELIALVGARGAPAQNRAVTGHDDLVVGHAKVGKRCVIQIEDLLDPLAALTLARLRIVIDNVRAEDLIDEPLWRVGVPHTAVMLDKLTHSAGHDDPLPIQTPRGVGPPQPYNSYSRVAPVTTPRPHHDPFAPT
jgi:hypothetical protein